MIQKLSMTFALILAITLNVAPAASAASACGSACNGKDPNIYLFAGRTCADDATVADDHVVLGRTLQLRYSPRCRTVWARVYGAGNGDAIRVENHVTGEREMEELFSTEGWTNMIDDANTTSRACWWIGWATNNNECTIWF